MDYKLVKLKNVSPDMAPLHQFCTACAPFVLFLYIVNLCLQHCHDHLSYFIFSIGWKLNTCFPKFGKVSDLRKKRVDQLLVLLIGRLLARSTSKTAPSLLVRLTSGGQIYTKLVRSPQTLPRVINQRIIFACFADPSGPHPLDELVTLQRGLPKEKFV